MKTIFSTPKEQLKVLKSNFFGVYAYQNVKQVMDACAEGTKYVEKLIYEGPAFHLGIAGAFIEKNRALLMFIELYSNHDIGDEKRKGLLDIFLQLPELQELYVSLKIPEDMLRNLKKRGGCCNRRC